MQVWGLHNPARYAFVATEGPVVLFEFPDCAHLGEGVELIDEIRAARSWLYLMAGPEAETAAASWADEIADLVREFGGGNRKLAVDRLDWMGYVALRERAIAVAEGQSIVESREELFGPAVAVSSFNDIDEAINMANDSRFGLSAGIFTQNIDWAMRFAKEVESGNLHINSSPQWRADLMPYGGLKDSGMGKEGPGYAVHEMTELKMVVFH